MLGRLSMFGRMAVLGRMALAVLGRVMARKMQGRMLFLLLFLLGSHLLNVFEPHQHAEVPISRWSVVVLPGHLYPDELQRFGDLVVARLFPLQRPVVPLLLHEL